MCLDYVISRPDYNDNSGTGFKVFNPSDNGGYKFEFAYLNHLSEVPTNQWLTAETRTIGSPGNLYQSGFHIFENEDEAQVWAQKQTVVKVEYRDVLATGRQGRRSVIVAKHMFVPSPGSELTAPGSELTAPAAPRTFLTRIKRWFSKA